MNLGDYGHFAQVVLQLASEDQAPPSPSEVVDWAASGALYDKLIERANTAGVDASAFAALINKPGFTQQSSSWGNVIDVQPKYGLTGGGGWLALLWFYVDLVNAHAPKVEVD